MRLGLELATILKHDHEMHAQINNIRPNIWITVSPRFFRSHARNVVAVEFAHAELSIVSMLYLCIFKVTQTYHTDPCPFRTK